MSRYKKYRIALCVYLFISVIFLASVYINDIKHSLPDTIKVIVDKDNDFTFNLPVEADIIKKETDKAVETLTISNAKVNNAGDIHFSMADSFTVNAGETGTCKLKLKLFGVFELSDISLDIIERDEVMPCGNVIGIHVDTDGLLVLGTGSVKGEDGLSYEQANQIVHTGDYIKKINGKEIESIGELQYELQKCDDNAVLTICRNDIVSDISVPVVTSEDGIKRIGVWVRQDTQGIGTLTYISPNGSFGALGHAITDTDTGVLMKLKKGTIYNAEIFQVIKGSKGSPGEIMGMILESRQQKIGKIFQNTSLGIAGKIDRNYDTSALQKNTGYGYIPIALRQEIKKGPAVILSQLGNRIKEYDIEIVEIDKGSNDNKGMVIKICDEELLNKAGGIVQGMSGSPIIQDGKIIGAVTHVLVNDPTRGYGIFIENMLEH